MSKALRSTESENLVVEEFIELTIDHKRGTGK